MTKPQYVYHGSQYLFDVVCPQQAHGANAYESQKAIYAAETIEEVIPFALPIRWYRSVRSFREEEEKAMYLFAALHMLRVLSYHAKLREQNQGAFYYMTDYHLNTFFGAYKRLTILAKEKTALDLL